MMKIRYLYVFHTILGARIEEEEKINRNIKVTKIKVCDCTSRNPLVD